MKTGNAFTVWLRLGRAVYKSFSGPKRLYLAGVVTKDGSVQSLVLMGNQEKSTADAVLARLAGWGLSPAVRNGQAVDIDFVVELTVP